MSIVKDVTRIDKARIVGSISRTDEGYLRGNAVVARTGILEYYENGGVVRELVTSDELFRPDSLETLKMKPVTNNHPSVKLLNASNVKQFQVGYTGENIKRDDGDLLASSITITDGVAIRDVDAGKRELSCGYTCDLIDEKGVWSGQRYDRKQVNRKYNHVAICDLARAGSVASLHLDASDVYECGNVDFKEVAIKTDNNQPLQRSYVMSVTIKVDGIEYKDQAPEVQRHIEKLDAQVASLDAKIVAAIKADGEKQVKIDALTAERDALKTQLDKAKEDAKTLPTQIVAAAKARSELVKQVTLHLDQETVAKIDSMSDVELKRHVALKAFPASKEKIDKLDATNVTGIDTWYDAAIATLSDNRFDSASAHNRQEVGGQHNDDSDKRPKTRQDSEDAVCNRYKKTTNRDNLLKG
jgi:hypothetical protein